MPRPKGGGERPAAPALASFPPAGETSHQQAPSLRGAGRVLAAGPSSWMREAKYSLGASTSIQDGGMLRIEGDHAAEIR